MPTLTQVQVEIGGTVPTVAYGNFQLKVSLSAAISADENPQVAIAGVLEDAREALSQQVCQSCSDDLRELAQNWTPRSSTSMTSENCYQWVIDRVKGMTWFATVDPERARGIVGEFVWPIIEAKLAKLAANEAEMEAKRLAEIAQREAEAAENDAIDRIDEEMGLIINRAEAAEKSIILIGSDYPPENDPDDLIVKNSTPAPSNNDDIPF